MNINELNEYIIEKEKEVFDLDVAIKNINDLNVLNDEQKKFIISTLELARVNSADDLYRFKMQRKRL